MARLRDMSIVYGIFGIFTACLFFVAGCGGPKNAKELGIAQKSQSELVWTVVTNMQEIERLRLESPHKAKRLAERNVKIAAFIDPTTPWVNTPLVVSDQYFSLIGAATSEVKPRIQTCADQMLIGLDYSESVWDLDTEAIRMAEDAINGIDDINTRIDYVFLTAPPEEMRRILNDRRLKAAEKLENSRKLYKQTGDLIPGLAARAMSERAESDWLIKWGQPHSDARKNYDAQAKKHLAQAKELYHRYHEDLLAPDEPVQSLTPITTL